MKYFGSFRLDCRGLLADAGRPVPLTRKAAALLRCLIQHAPTCVSHEEILAAVWPQTHVQPDNIKVLIHEIRHALADDPQDPRFIRNHPGRGYAFAGSVSDAALPQPRRAVGDPVSLTRLRELGLLRDRLEAAHTGTPQMVFVAGERGSGRSHLCDAFVGRAAADGAILVAYAQGLETTGAPEPYGVLHDLLRQLRERYPERVNAALARYPAALPDDSASRRMAARAVHDICHAVVELAQDEPLVLVIDDLQWCDRHTLEVLRAFARWRHTPARILCVATYAVAPTGRVTATLRELLFELRALHGCDVLPLPPLDAIGVHRIVAARFDETLADAIGMHVHRITGGHASTVAAVLQHLASGAGMRLSPAHWTTASAEAISAALQDGARESIMWRLANTERGDRELLEAAAVVGMSFTSADVATALAGSVESVADRLDRLASWGLVHSAGEADPRSYRFWHPFHPELLARGAGGFDMLRAVSNLSPFADGQCEIA